MELFDGYQVGRDEVVAAGWIKEESGFLSGHRYWERWVSPDGKLITTFYNGYVTASICRNV